MIVNNIGYLNLNSVLEIDHFSIYKTHKNTQILVKNTSVDILLLYFPKKDRLPWKLLEGKKICSGEKVFDSKTDSLIDIDITQWNGRNQIMAYEKYKL